MSKIATILIAVLPGVTVLAASTESPMDWTQIIQLGSAAGAVAVAVLFLREQRATREAFLTFMTQERDRQNVERKTYLQFVAAEFALHRKAIHDEAENSRRDRQSDRAGGHQ